MLVCRTAAGLLQRKKKLKKVSEGLRVLWKTWGSLDKGSKNIMRGQGYMDIGSSTER